MVVEGTEAFNLFSLLDSAAWNWARQAWCYCIASAANYTLVSIIFLVGAAWHALARSRPSWSPFNIVNVQSSYVQRPVQ